MRTSAGRLNNGNALFWLGRRLRQPYGKSPETHKFPQSHQFHPSKLNTRAAQHTASQYTGARYEIFTCNFKTTFVTPGEIQSLRGLTNRNHALSHFSPSKIQATLCPVKTRVVSLLPATQHPTSFLLVSLCMHTTTMPSFLKKLFLGKELSNPYVNQYHPGHRATPQPTQHVPNYAEQAMNPNPTRLPPRSDSPTYLEEARRLADRDPITGRALSPQQFDSYAARSGQTISPTGHGNPQPRPAAHPIRTSGGENPYVTGGDAAVGRVEQDRQRTLKTNGQSKNGVGMRSDVFVREERRRRMLKEERAQAERLRERGVGGYFAPEREVREYYGGT